MIVIAAPRCFWFLSGAPYMKEIRVLARIGSLVTNCPIFPPNCPSMQTPLGYWQTSVS